MTTTVYPTAWVRAHLRDVLMKVAAGEVVLFGPRRVATVGMTQPPGALSGAQLSGALAVMADTCGYVLANPTTPGGPPQLPGQARPLIRHLWDTDPTHRYLTPFADLTVVTISVQGGPTGITDRENLVTAAIAHATGQDQGVTAQALFGDREPTTPRQAP